MANRVFFKRQNGVDGSEVSLLWIKPQLSSALNETQEVQAFSGFFDLECTGPDNGMIAYTMGPMLWDEECSTFTVTITFNAPFSLAKTNQQYQTIMLPFYLDTYCSINVNEDISIDVIINYYEGTTDGFGNEIQNRTKKGKVSTTNPNVQPIIGFETQKPIKSELAPHVVLFDEKTASADGENPADLFGVPRFQIFQSYTQPNQYFILLIATTVDEYKSTEDTSGSCIASSGGNLGLDSNYWNGIEMTIYSNTQLYPCQALGQISASKNEYDFAVTSGNQYCTDPNGDPYYPTISAPTKINNIPNDLNNDYDSNAIMM